MILGCRALLLLHDDHGRPLLVTTHRGDQHLTTGVPAFLARYEQHAAHCQVTRMIVDREGMATEFLAGLHAEGRSVVTILQTKKSRDLSSFSDVGAFVPPPQGYSRAGPPRSGSRSYYLAPRRRS